MSSIGCFKPGVQVACDLSRFKDTARATSRENSVGGFLVFARATRIVPYVKHFYDACQAKSARVLALLFGLSSAHVRETSTMLCLKSKVSKMALAYLWHVFGMCQRKRRRSYLRKRGLKIGAGISLARVRDVSEETSKILFAKARS